MTENKGCCAPSYLSGHGIYSHPDYAKNRQIAKWVYQDIMAVINSYGYSEFDIAVAWDGTVKVDGMVFSKADLHHRVRD